MNLSSWCLSLLQQPDLALLGISWQSWALPSRSCWAGDFSLPCYRSCTVTHTLWVGLMDAFFLCLLLTLVPGGFSQALQQQGGTVPVSAAWLGLFQPGFASPGLDFPAAAGPSRSV